MSQSNHNQSQAGTLRWLFAISVFIASLTGFSALIFIIYYLFQCGIPDSNSSGDWCGAGAMITIPFWGPVAFLLSVIFSTLALRSSSSKAAMTLTVGFVMTALFVLMAS